MADSRTASILVVGYGNTLRRDDALGCLIAGEVGRWQRPGVRSMSLAQLTPELAAELAAAETAVFVDARESSQSSEPTVQVEPLSPRGEDWASLVHAITPCVLLGLCKAAFGQCPRAWQVSVPGSDFSFGEELSDMADRGMGDALGMIETLLARAGSPEPDPALECPRSSSPQAPLASQDSEHEHAHHPG
jgi:hydrogenase maturation protease